MGCINNIKIRDTSITSVIVSNKLPKEAKEKRKYSQSLNHYNNSKNQNNETRQTNISQNIEEFIENNPLPFVKIIRKKNHL